MFNHNSTFGEGEFHTVILSCLHTLQFQKPMPKPGETVLCFKCDEYKRAIVPPDSYRVECRDCTRAPDRSYGGASLTAELAADKHARKNVGHRVRVMNGEKVVSERMRTQEPTLLDAPPF